jgi:tetratricopeptide (TPR) repeat protein
MEFLNGESLATRIKREGALALDVAFNIARQLASGIEAARALGVVHRDIKPGNIMLVSDEPGERAVITDFGLAYAESVDAARTLPGNTVNVMPLGTLAYMAPEQLEGRPVSPATDTYAFGLVLFEMITGRQAFPASALLSGIARRLSGQLPDASAIVPGLPRHWTRTISACLEVRPEDRPRLEKAVAALEAGNLLGRDQGRLARITNTLRFLLAPARLAVAAAAGLILLSLFWAGFRYSSLRGNPRVEPGALVYLAPVRNETSVKLFNSATELIRACLAQSSQINLLDLGRVGNTLQRMGKTPDTLIDQPIAREIAMRTNAARVVFVAVRGAQGKYELDVDVEQLDNTPARARKHWQKAFPWYVGAEGTNQIIPTSLLSATRDASDWVREEVGESRNDIARLNSAPEDVTTSSWEALVQFERAEELYSQNRPDQALNSLKAAVKIDPKFALAYARLGDIAFSLGRAREAYEAYAQALGTDFDRRLSRRELDRIRGIYASDSWDYETAESAFRDYTVFYEGDYFGWFYRALPLMRLGRFEEAIATLKQAYAIDPHRPGAPSDLVICYIEKRDTQSAQQWIGVLKQMGQIDIAAQLEGILAFLDGRYSDAEINFLAIRNSQSPMYRLRAYSFLTRLAAERGDRAGALGWADAGIEEAKLEGNGTEYALFLMDRASIRPQSGADLRAALDDVKQSLALDDSPETLIKASEFYGRALEVPTNGLATRIRTDLSALSNRLPRNTESMAYQNAAFRVHTELLVADKKWVEAVEEAHRAANSDMQFRRRSYLGRSLMAAFDHMENQQLKSKYLAEARAAYGRTALDPATIWVQPSLYNPGALVEDMDFFLQLSEKSGVVDDTKEVRQRLAELHAAAPGRQSRVNVPSKKEE